MFIQIWDYQNWQINGLLEQQGSSFQYSSATKLISRQFSTSRVRECLLSGWPKCQCVYLTGELSVQIQTPSLSWSVPPSHALSCTKFSKNELYMYKDTYSRVLFLKNAKNTKIWIQYLHIFYSMYKIKVNSNKDYQNWQMNGLL
jgi:hypothetical protein